MYLTVSGEYTLSDFITYIKMIAEECEKEKIYRALLNVLDVKESNIPNMDRFYLGTEVAKVLGSKIKIALVAQDENINKYGETVALNRGALINIVGNVATAEEWLLNGV